MNPLTFKLVNLTAERRPQAATSPMVCQDAEGKEWKAWWDTEPRRERALVAIHTLAL